MSFKKKNKKSSSSIGAGSGRPQPNSLGTYGSSAGGATGGKATSDRGTSDSTRTKLFELFGQIEHQFELLHGENSACKFS